MKKKDNEDEMELVECTRTWEGEEEGEGEGEGEEEGEREGESLKTQNDNVEYQSTHIDQSVWV